MCNIFYYEALLKHWHPFMNYVNMQDMYFVNVERDSVSWNIPQMTLFSNLAATCNKHEWANL